MIGCIIPNVMVVTVVCVLALGLLWALIRLELERKEQEDRARMRRATQPKR